MPETREYILSNYMKVVVEDFADRREVSLFNEAGDIIGDAVSSDQANDFLLRVALNNIVENCEAASRGFTTSKSWAAVGKIARNALGG